MGNVGVVIGRFQVPSLHEGHVALLREVQNRSKLLVVMIGVTQAQPNLNDPLPFACRAAAVRHAFPEAIILPLQDQALDDYWSDVVDTALSPFVPAGSVKEDNVTIYGGRGNSLHRYTGRWKTETLQLDINEISGQRVRDEEYIQQSEKFRAGMVYAAKIKLPTSYQCVDIAALKEEFVLLGRKQGEKLWRFPGGFVDPSDATLEAAAKRELSEECGPIETSPMLYAGSTRIDDWRYRGSADKVMTSLYVTEVLWGSAVAADDLEAVAWVNIGGLREVHPVHQPLVRLLETFLAEHPRANRLVQANTLASVPTGH